MTCAKILPPPGWRRSDRGPVTLADGLAFLDRTNCPGRQNRVHRRRSQTHPRPDFPHTPAKLEADQAGKIEAAILAATGLSAKAVLDGQTLNHQVGYIGYEQHLRRFPGDTLLEHDDEQIAGVAPGLGAWGYFARSKSEFTTQDYLREKWYSVAQTLYLPNWNTDFVHLRDWYKYRKILVVNPANGTAVVTVLGDAGPAKWTGKQFGGSPKR